MAYIFRAYYAVPYMCSHDRIPTNAVYGFHKLLQQMLQEVEPDYLAVAFDLAEPTFRKEAYSDYKANRPAPPEDLLEQIPIVREYLRRLRQILVLRKLRVSLKEIGDILADSGSAAAVAVLEKNLAEMDGEILAMTTVRDVIREFLDALKQRRMLPAGETILEDGRLMVLADSLAPSSTLIHRGYSRLARCQ